MRYIKIEISILIFVFSTFILQNINARNSCSSKNLGLNFYRKFHRNKDWSKETENYLRDLVRDCQKKGVKCSEAEVRRLENMTDTLQPITTKGKKPSGVDPIKGFDSKNILTDETRRSLEGEIFTAEQLSKKGYEVEYASKANKLEKFKLIRLKEGYNNSSDFDLLINGHGVDVYTPFPKTSINNIVIEVAAKADHQAHRIVVNLGERSSHLNDPLFRDEIRKEILKNNNPNIHEVLVLKPDGSIDRVYP